jgi:catechol 2,3-dioxygenase-like lactoylglutathione lyase family enzyme
MQPAASLITLGVTDFNRSLRFYRDGLGWPTTAKESDPVAFFQLHNIILGLWSREELAKDARIPNTKPGFGGISIAHNVGSEKEVDDVLATAERVGAKILKPAEKVFWGGYSGYFADPEGHLWEVAYNPHWKLDERGMATLA